MGHPKKESIPTTILFQVREFVSFREGTVLGFQRGCQLLPKGCRFTVCWGVQLEGAGVYSCRVDAVVTDNFPTGIDKART